MDISFLPKQKVSTAEKTKDSSQWGKDTIKAILDNSEFGTIRDLDYLKLYGAYNGELDMKTDYGYVSDPYKTKEGKQRQLPARIRNYNIIKPVVDLLLGEKARRPNTFSVINSTPEAVNTFQEKKKELVTKYYKQLLVNIANEEGMETGQEDYDTSQLEKLIRNFNTSYKDGLAIQGQDSLEYIKYNLDLVDKFLTGFFDFVVTGLVVSYKNVMHKDIEYEIFTPDDICYDKSQGVTFIQDGSWVSRRKLMTINDIVDTFWDELTEEDIEELESGYSSYGSDWLASILREDKSNDPKRALPVYHVAWKAFAKVGFLERENEYGEIETIEVDDTYVPLKGEKIDWYWVNEVWEGHRLGNDKYIGIRKLPGQRASIDNPSKCKLPYNGRIYSDRNAKPISVVSIGLPYQILYNIFHYRLELSIAKNKDKILLMEMNTIPKRHGWDEEKFMYHMDASGVAYVDSTASSKSGDKISFNQWSVLDMSLGQYISSQFELLATIKGEWEQLMGITPQRLGDIKTSAGKGITERAVFQSAVISEELFRRFETFEQSEMQGLLDLSQIAWIDGKKAMYISSEGKNSVLDIDAENYPYAELGIFAWYSADEREKLESLRSLSLEFTQNGGKPSTIAEILDAKNFEKIKTLLKEVDERQEQAEMAAAQREQESMERIEQMRLEDREDTQLHERELVELDNATKVLIKQMELSAKGMPIEGEKLEEEKRKNMAKESLEEEKLKIEREALKVQERISRIREARSYKNSNSKK